MLWRKDNKNIVNQEIRCNYVVEALVWEGMTTYFRLFHSSLNCRSLSHRSVWGRKKAGTFHVD